MTADREVCGAERFMRSSGPSAVPLRACCAAAILHAAEGDRTSAPFVCAEADRLTTRTDADAAPISVAGRLSARTDVEAAPISAAGRLSARTDAEAAPISAAGRLSARTDAEAAPISAAGRA